MQAGARGEHPAGKNPLDIALQRHLVDFDERIGIGRLGRRARIAGAWRHLEGAELHRFADGGVERGGAAGDLVETGKYRPAIVDVRRRRFDHRIVLRRGGSGGRRRLRIPRRRCARATLRRRRIRPAMAAAPVPGWRRHRQRRAAAATAVLRLALRPPDMEAGSDTPALLGWDRPGKAEPAADRAVTEDRAATADKAAVPAADRPAVGILGCLPARVAPGGRRLGRKSDHLGRPPAGAAAHHRKCCRIAPRPAGQRKFRRSPANRQRCGLSTLPKWTGRNMGAMGSTASLGSVRLTVRLRHFRGSVPGRPALSLVTRNPRLVIASRLGPAPLRQCRPTRTVCASSTGEIGPVRLLPGMLPRFVLRWWHINCMVQPPEPARRHSRWLCNTGIDDPAPFEVQRRVDLAALGSIIPVAEFVLRRPTRHRARSTIGCRRSGHSTM